jgi:hypothetical protein
MSAQNPTQSERIYLFGPLSANRFVDQAGLCGSMPAVARRESASTTLSDARQDRARLSPAATDRWCKIACLRWTRGYRRARGGNRGCRGLAWLGFCAAEDLRVTEQRRFWEGRGLLK